MKNEIHSTLDLRKSYSKPEIIEELELETRAGSPLSVPNPIDLLNGE